MIDEAKTLEFSGRSAALLKWGGYSKLMVLSLVLINVLLAPWGLATRLDPGALVLSMLFVGGKLLIFVAVLAAIETSFAKLRLFRIQDFLGLAFVTAVLAMIVEPFHL
jgi:formate hydrogenlyase subunit 4